MNIMLDAEDIDPSFVPRFRDEVEVITLQDESVIYQPEPSWLHQLDAVATVICSFFDGETSIATAVDELARGFAADREVVEADVLALARKLGQMGLLQGVRQVQQQGPTGI